MLNRPLRFLGYGNEMLPLDDATLVLRLSRALQIGPYRIGS